MHGEEAIEFVGNLVDREGGGVSRHRKLLLR